ncbi:MAG: ATP-binding protein [Defluviicoccus sp.]|nr:ATP-binding protein [Defluviicoccus sp.]MDE0382392.1 ATP-binding protein [Defluviicoccus sp.]
MRSGSVILGVSLSAILLAAAAYLYLFAHDGSSRHYRKSIDLVRQMQILSTGWSMEVTRVRSDPLADFDSLAGFIPRVARLKLTLAQRAQRIPDLPDRIAGEINAFISAIEAQEERIERFKTGYAVVRNSKRYLPLAAASVSRQAASAGNSRLVEAVSPLVRDVNLYVATPTQTAKSRLKVEIDELRKTNVRYPPPLANALGNMLDHAEVLVDRQRRTEDLFAQATSDELSRFADQLAVNLEFELGRAAVQARYYDHGVVALFGALALFWIGLALHYRLGGRREAVRPAPAQGIAAEAHAPAAPPPQPRAPFAPHRSRPDASAPVARQSIGPPTPRDPTSVLQNGFVVKCVAGILASSADEIGDRMEFLQKTHERIRHALHHSDLPTELAAESGLDEEVAAIPAIASSVRQRLNGIASLAKRLEAFSNTQANHVDRTMIDVNDCIEGVIAAAGSATDATFITNLGEVPRILASQTDLQMLVAELVENSLAAVQVQADKKGIVKIDTARKDGEIMITVIDNGVGISADRQRSIFKPFYTSREGSLGIGLPLAGHLVGKYRGTIKVNSLPGQGTVARISLPVGTAR